MRYPSLFLWTIMKRLNISRRTLKPTERIELGHLRKESWKTSLIQISSIFKRGIICGSKINSDTKHPNIHTLDVELFEHLKPSRTMYASFQVLPFI